MHLLDSRSKKITDTETVLQPLPNKDFRFANPFIVLHHQPSETIIPGTVRRIHPHPHRGFSPVTILLQGEGFHRDSAGNEGLLRAGDVQWMHAGKGILHSEGPTPNFLRRGGAYEMIQLWINSPKAFKSAEPSYQLALYQQQPQISSTPTIDLRLISGEYEGHTGPLKSFTPITMISGRATAGEQVQLTAIPGYWTLLYIASGSVRLNGEAIHQHQLVVFEKENDEIMLSFCADTQFLYLCGEPIDEPVAAGGNFVMNTQEEINQAKADEAAGRFGNLSH